MPNPQIHLSGDPGGEPRQPPTSRPLWIVYRLRYHGRKVDGEVAKRLADVGVLRLEPAEGCFIARLVDPEGFPILHNLWDARVVRMTADGLLLHGRTVDDKPQAWWCMVHGLRKQKKPPTASEAVGG